MATAQGAATGAINGWRGPSSGPDTMEELAYQYAYLWSLHDGTAFSPAWKRQGPFKDFAVYRNIRLIASHVSSVGKFYAAHVYQGSLATDGQRLPNGTLGAIPIDPQTSDDAQNAAIRSGCAELWNRWRWQQFMHVRPLWGSVLGTGITELIDDPAHHIAWPQQIWPGYLVDFDLNPAGDLLAYTLEYPITEVAEDGRETTYTFRKEVDREWFKYFRDGDPWDKDGSDTAETPNIYGFVPAILDRHELTPGDRGKPAIQESLQALAELNSLASSSIDYMRKTFGAPIIVRGSTNPQTGQSAPRTRPVIGPARTVDPSAIAEALTFKEVSAEGGIEILQFDIGQTIAMLDWVKADILERNPEAAFYQQLREMSTLTGPAVERALGDATSRVTLARAGYDTQLIKLLQMALTICGTRLNAAEWEKPTPRDDAFRAFDLGTYAQGGIDMSILDRPIVPRTDDERLAYLLQRETIRYPDTWVELGLTEAEATTRVANRQTTDLSRVEAI